MELDLIVAFLIEVLNLSKSIVSFVLIIAHEGGQFRLNKKN